MTTYSRAAPEAMARAVAEFLVACGLDPKDSDFTDTARLVAQTWSAEFLIGYTKDAATILGQPIVGESDPDVVMISFLKFHAMCPHHLFPFRGVAHIAYMPQGKIVGFGSIAELLEMYAARFTLQERITHAVARALMEHLGCRGAGVVTDAEQLCLALPGDKHDHSRVISSAFLGDMDLRDDIKGRLLAMTT